MTPAYIHAGRRALFNVKTDSSLAAQIINAPNGILNTLTEVQRMELFHALYAGEETITKQAETAIQYLLRQRPYPETARIRDEKVTRRFHALWLNSSLHTRHPALISPKRAFEKACRMALEAMDLQRRPVYLTVARKELFPEGHTLQFQASASVVTRHDRMGHHVEARLNHHCPLWRWSPSQTRNDIRIIGYTALHEMTHVEQSIEAQRDKVKGFHKVMAEEAALPLSLSRTFPIYRSMLIERQAYYRGHMLADIFHGFAIRREDFYTRAHINMDYIEKAAQAPRLALAR